MKQIPPSAQKPHIPPPHVGADKPAEQPRFTRSAGNLSTLTKRQSEVLAFIKAFQAEQGFGPSYEQIAEKLGLASRSGIHRIVYGLQRRGMLRKSKHYARQYEFDGRSDDGAVALHHLQEILAAVGKDRLLWAGDHRVVKAMRFLGRA